MMPIETEAETKERAWGANEFDEGMSEGYSADLNALPMFYYAKTLYKLTARQRGYWFGRELRAQEEREKPAS